MNQRVDNLIDTLMKTDKLIKDQSNTKHMMKHVREKKKDTDSLVLKSISSSVRPRING